MSADPHRHAADFAIVARQWRDLTGEPLAERVSNRVEDRVERGDGLLFTLTERAFGDAAFLDRLERLSGQWLRRCPCATTRAIAAYAAYLREDFGRACTLLLACLSDAPDNLDTWIDLAFALNHQGDPLGRHILFNHDVYIERYVASSAPICTLTHLRDIGAEIERDGVAYADAWSSWLDGVEPRL